MAERSVQEIVGIGSDAERLWEVFHENSKNSRAALATSSLSTESLLLQMQSFHESLPYPERLRVPLPEQRLSLDTSLDRAILARHSTRQFVPRTLTFAEISTILHYAYGMTRDNGYGPYPPCTRAVPSAGALYPLEVYFRSSHVEGLAPGIYHYNPKENALDALGASEQSLAASTIYPDFVESAAVTLFITAVFERTTWKYGDRGYRYALFEAGHVAQNAALVAAALGLGCFSLGGFIDREIDDLLGLDGVTHSTLCMLCLGGHAPGVAEAAPP